MKALIALFMAVGALGFLAPVAPAAHAVEAGPSELAPACIRNNVDVWEDSSLIHAKVTNMCQDTQRVRVIWDWATDSNCATVPPKKYVHFFQDKWGTSYDRLESC